LKPEATAAIKRWADWEVQLVRRMNEEHVGLLAGTDVANPWTIPSVALHDELSALVEAGLTPLESLRTATLNPCPYRKYHPAFKSLHLEPRLKVRCSCS
jgi:imidazolonepropionase-like amidohydrolase